MNKYDFYDESTTAGKVFDYFSSEPFDGSWIFNGYLVYANEFEGIYEDLPDLDRLYSAIEDIKAEGVEFENPIQFISYLNIVKDFEFNELFLFYHALEDDLYNIIDLTDLLIQSYDLGLTSDFSQIKLLIEECYQLTVDSYNMTNEDGVTIAEEYLTGQNSDNDFIAYTNDLVLERVADIATVGDIIKEYGYLQPCRA